MNRLLAAVPVLCALALSSCVPPDKAPTSVEASKSRSDGPPLTALSSPPGCLAQSGNTLTLTGPTLQGPDPWIHSNLPGETPPYTKVDATQVRFLYPQSVNQPLEFGGAGVCWRGGEILGQFPPSTPFWDPGMHTKYAMLPGHYYGGNDIQVENVSIFDYGDGISFDQNGASIDRWVIRDVHIKYGRDDCVENDAYWNGTIESSFLEGCNTGVSSRSDSRPAHRENVITMNNSLVSLQSMDVSYLDPNSNQVGPSHHGFWEWNLSDGPKVALSGNWFRVDGKYAGQNSGANQQDFLVLPVDRIDLTTCQNNVIVWLGPPSTDPNYPDDLKNLSDRVPPACIRIETAADGGLTHWNTQVEAWNATHTPTLPDVTPPIVSMFPPPQYWPSTTYTGTVPLIATAVDDRGVYSVRFQIDNKDIGTATPPADRGDGTTGPTKYNFSWNSRYYGDGTSVANGSHTLRAIARDDLGQETPSAGVPVIVSNPNQPPVASFTFSCTQLACSFTSTSTDPDGTVASYAWAFGDGSTSTLQNPSHTYAAGGTYTVTLTVTDNGGAASAPTSTPVTVSAPPPPPLAPPTNCSIQRQPATGTPVYLKVSWTNGDPSASTEVWIQRNGIWTYQSTEAPGISAYYYSMGYPPQTGLFYGRVRHVKAGYPSSPYCVTGSTAWPP